MQLTTKQKAEIINISFWTLMMIGLEIYYSNYCRGFLYILFGNSGGICMTIENIQKPIKAIGFGIFGFMIKKYSQNVIKYILEQYNQ